VIDIVQDPLTGEWVSLANARQSRPLTRPGTACPFCPGPETEVGTKPFHVAVIDNRFPVFDHPGAAEVVVYSPRHDDDYGYLDSWHARLIWRVWQDRTRALLERPDVTTVFVFENRGRRIGATIDHPHGQIYGYPYWPARLQREHAHGGVPGDCRLCRPEDLGLPVVDTAAWHVVVPHAMRMPYQLMLIPRAHAANVTQLADPQVSDGADLLQRVYQTYDRLFGFRAALALAVFQPALGQHLRIECLPIDRGQFRQKYLAASELAMGAFVTDIPAAVAQDQLRALITAMPTASRWTRNEQEGDPHDHAH